MPYKIAIDGPASAGKSTIAKLIAKELGYIYIDTGAIYRAFALYLLNNNIDYNDEEEIKKVIDKINIDIKYENNEQNLYLNNINVTNKIRTSEVSKVASISSQYKTVRDELLFIQKDLSNTYSCVMDGRDIASRIMPDANIKIFLTATVECRAKRRYLEEKEKGNDITEEKVLEELKERDYRDTHRDNDPLIAVDDAIIINSTNMSLEQVLDKILCLTTGDCK